LSFSRNVAEVSNQMQSAHQTPVFDRPPPLAGEDWSYALFLSVTYT